MKLERVLHPEMVLGLRGHPLRQKYFEQELSKIVEKEGKPALFIDQFRLETAFQQELLFAYLYWKHRPEIYYPGRDFLAALTSVDRELPIELLPKQFFSYFAFPKQSLFDGEDYVSGAYIWISSEEQVPQRLIYSGCRPKDPYVLIVYFTEEVELPGDPVPAYRVGYFSRPLEAMTPSKLFQTIGDLTDDALTLPNESAKSPEKSGVVLQACLNLVLYIHSREPNVDHLRPSCELSKSGRIGLERKGQQFVEDARLSLKLLNWNYHRPMTYSVDSTWVETYPRWQRCGPENKECRLVWVRAHERYFKNHGLTSQVSREQEILASKDQKA